MSAGARPPISGNVVRDVQTRPGRQGRPEDVVTARRWVCLVQPPKTWPSSPTALMSVFSASSLASSSSVAAALSAASIAAR